MLQHDHHPAEQFDSYLESPASSSGHASNYYYPPTSNMEYSHAQNYVYESPAPPNGYCSCCPHPYGPSSSSFTTDSSSYFLANSNYNSGSSQTDVASLPTDTFRQTTTIVILTSDTFASAPLLSHIFHSLSPFLHRSLLYIEDLAQYQPPPPTANIVFLIWLHHFDAPLCQALDTAVLAHLHAAYARHFFLVLNAPSQLLVEHLHSTAVDKQSILVLNYHSTDENELVLLCSGHRGTFEFIRSSLLECICPKVKYIESTDEQAFSAYTVASVLQSANVLHHFVDRQIQQTLNERFDSNFLRHNQGVIDELFPSAPQPLMPTSTPATHQRSLVQTMNADVLKDKSKQADMMHDLFRNEVIQTRTAPPICQYYVQSVLDEH